MTGSDISYIQYLPQAAAVILLVFAAISDLRRYLIPNWLCLLLAALFPVQAWLVDMSLQEALIRAGAALVILVAGLMNHARAHMGGGDIKLVAALMLWIAPSNWLLFLLGTAVFGGILALLLLFLRKSSGAMPEFVLKVGGQGNLLKDGAGIPYGVAISLAGLASLFGGFLGN